MVGAGSPRARYSMIYFSQQIGKYKYTRLGRQDDKIFKLDSYSIMITNTRTIQSMRILYITEKKYSYMVFTKNSIYNIIYRLLN